MRFPRFSRVDGIAIVLFLVLVALLIATSAPARTIIYQSF
jgi:hypothetical protein